MRVLLLVLLSLSLFSCSVPRPEAPAPQADRGIRRTASESGERVALVLGNARYTTSPLKNPVRDAQAMASLLEDAQFEVMLLEDASYAQMEEALNAFGEKLSRARVALFYYAGHGVQSQGRNYLMPVDAAIRKPHELRYQTMELGRILDTMESAGSATNLVILDACRNNPFESAWRSEQRGLAPVRAPGGTFVAFATAPGEVAADGTGQHGLYTEALLRNLRTPGVPVELAFKRVRQDVLLASNQQQVPWDQSSLTADFRFFPAAEGSEAEATPVPVVVCEEACQQQRLASMRQEFAALREQELTRPDPAKLVQRWQAFLQNHQGRSASVTEENTMRAKARKQLAFWKQEQQALQSNADQKQRQWAQGTWTEPATQMEFVAVEGDPFFRKGNLLVEDPQWEEVAVPRFWMSRYEVTLAQWEALMTQPTEAPPADSVKGWVTQTLRKGWESAKQVAQQYLPEKQIPVVGKTSSEVADFLSRLNALHPEGPEIRLPTAAEWEYACREGGRRTRFGTGKMTLSLYDANFQPEADRPDFVLGPGRDTTKLAPVGSYEPNALGLYDLSGNAAEWVDGLEQLRGGSFQDDSTALQCATSQRARLWGPDPTAGLRLVRGY